MRALLIGIGLLAATSAPAAVEFNQDIRPILSNNCFHCHGPDGANRQAGLRLDVRSAALDHGAIVPGDVAASKIVQRIGHENEMLRMPPSYSNKSLTEDQRKLLVQWIEEGAEYEDHWAYRKPVRPEAPEGPAAIDHLLNARLAKAGLTPVGEADRRTLARRLSFDLTGLPPDAELVERFVESKDSDAYAKLVDELLDSPHFGERMAIYWLDLVRYADTTGFHNDVPYNVYPYRDYVIQAFNENKPFDQFTIEQLGGDLMEKPTDETLVASAYNRLNRLTTEGGAQPKEYLAKYASDRTSTTATVWLGSTLGCAECHDHKFDPFLTKEFYQIGAFFADIEEVGVFGRDGDYGPQHRILRPEDRQEAARLNAELSRLRADGVGKLADTAKNRRAVEDYFQEKAGGWTALEPDSAKNDCSDPDVDGCDDLDLHIEKKGMVRASLNSENNPRESAYITEYPIDGRRIGALLFEAFPEEGFDRFYLSRIQVQLLGRDHLPMNVRFADLVADREEVDAPLRDTLEENPHSGWEANTETGGVRRAMYTLEQAIEGQAGERLRITMIFNGPGGGGSPGRYKISSSDVDFPELPSDADRFSETAANANWREIRGLERELKRLWDRGYETHVAHAVDSPREMRILPRGNWMDESGQVVRPQTPGFLGEIAEKGRRLNRLDFGKWLVSDDNPLTARVFVNRLWKMYFGVGISKTLDDMGSQGEPPVHPKLLDWLAVEFVESGWDVKHIIRTMLLTDAYRRSSEPTPELVEKDPYNRLYARQAMFRLDAELIRDNALEVSGLLNEEMGGPSIKPYQPQGYYVELNFPKREYEPDYDDDQFRRGVYTHWQRTFLHPSLMAFDAPAREECTAERPVSNTPLQSLALLNDPSYVEAARAFAGRIMAAEKDSEERIRFAFEQAFSRAPTAEEIAVLAQLVKDQQARFAADPERARELLSVGITPPPTGDPVEVAAWTTAARALFNKHEFVMRY